MIRNGKEFFNRPIYGVSSPTQSGDFRVDAGDLPEFSMYLPGHGGNLKLGIIGAGGAGSKWAADADEVVARYRPGRMIYEIRDGLLGKGMLRAEVLTTGVGAGFMVKVEGQDVPARDAAGLGVCRSERAEGSEEWGYRVREAAGERVLPGEAGRM